MACPCSKLQKAENAWSFRRRSHTVTGMLRLLSALGSLLLFGVRSRLTLELELVALRQQLTVLRRQHPGRPRLFSADRLLWAWLYRFWPQVLDAMVLVKPATVVQWHRKGFRLYWRRRSRHLGRPGIKREIRDLIRKMSQANPLWGAPRIDGELLKLGNPAARRRQNTAEWRVHAMSKASTNATASTLQDAVQRANLPSTVPSSAGCRLNIIAAGVPIHDTTDRTDFVRGASGPRSRCPKRRRGVLQEAR